MTRILFIVQIPETVDTDPPLPPGFNAEKIRAGIAIAEAEFAARGWQSDTCLIPPDETAAPMVEAQLAAARYDGVVIGIGLVRLPPKSLRLLDTALYAVGRRAPKTPVAFNTRPRDSAEELARWLRGRSQ